MRAKSHSPPTATALSLSAPYHTLPPAVSHRQKFGPSLHATISLSHCCCRPFSTLAPSVVPRSPTNDYQRDTNGLTSENSELKLCLQTMEQQVHLLDALNDALNGANQQYFSNNYAMNTLLTAQQLQQLPLHSQKQKQKQQQQHQFQQHQLHQFQQQQLQHQQEADMKLRSSMQSSMEKDRASDSSSKD